jgi:hypothetical protein
MHALMHSQLQAPVYRNMIRYTWYAAKLIYHKVVCSVHQYQHSMMLNICSIIVHETERGNPLRSADVHEHMYRAVFIIHLKIYSE